MARPYDENHREALRDQLALPVAERTCPICAHTGLRSYHHEEFGRSSPSMINYLWCPDCHGYYSSFTAADRHTVDRDPLAEAHGDRIAEVMRDPEGLLRLLDGYWAGGSLPQRMLRRSRG